MFVWVIPLLAISAIVISISHYVANNLIGYYAADIWLQGKSMPAVAEMFMYAYVGNAALRTLQAIYVIGGLIIGYFALKLIFRQATRIVVDIVRMRMPLIKEIYRLGQLFSFAVPFSLALKADLSLSQAFGNSIASVSSRKYGQQLNQALDLLDNGFSLEEIMADCDIFSYEDKMMLEMAIVNTSHLSFWMEYITVKQKKMVVLKNIFI